MFLTFCCHWCHVTVYLGFNGFRYTVDESVAIWPMAVERCRDLYNGELATVKNQAEQDFIAANFKGKPLWLGLQKHVS